MLSREVGAGPDLDLIETSLVAVIIVNHNGYKLTRDCLCSFKKTTYDHYILIVVDNASDDGSVALLQQEFPNVRYIRSETNLGYTGGNNLGLNVAFEMGSHYVFFLNNDTVVSDNIFELATFLTTNSDVGMVAPLTYYYDNPKITSFGGGHLNRNTGRISFINKGKRYENILDKVIYCSFLEGAALMARTELVNRVGGFNDDYFLTSEESELCVRIMDMGYRLALITSCSVWHKVSQTMKPGSELINYFVYRNRLFFIRNNALRLGPLQVVSIIRNYIFSFFSLLLKRRNIPAVRGLIFGVIDFIRGVRGVGRYRSILQPKSRVIRQEVEKP